MKKKLCPLLYFPIIMLLFVACTNNDFKIVSNENKLIKNAEIMNLSDTDELINYEYQKSQKYTDEEKRRFIWDECNDFNKKLFNVGFGYFSSQKLSEILDSKDPKYQEKIKIAKAYRLKLEKEDADYENNWKREEKKWLHKTKLKGINSKLILKNNSDQIIEKGHLTILLKCTFENEKVFNFIKNYTLIGYGQIWKKNQTLNLNFNHIISFAATDEKKILKIHTPKNVTLEYYVTAKNSIDFNNLGKTKETLNSGFYSESAKLFGIFTSKEISNEELAGFGDRIFSEDITDLWNENNAPENKSQITKKPINGDLDKTFVSKETSKKKNENNYKKEKAKLLSEGWKDEEVKNGQLPSCYNFIPAKGKVKNKLEVIVGSGTDVSIKIMDVITEKCIRYVFINSRTTHNISNIPEGEYYLKIAYGKDWLSKVENGQCIGKFIQNPLYEKGEDILDFNIRRTSNGSSIPSYQLSLDIISSGIANSFNSQNISESDFNK